MQEIDPDPELARLLADYRARGGVLDYVFLRSSGAGSGETLHRSAALAGMAAIDRRYEEHIRRYAAHLLENRHRVTWDAPRLVGEKVTLETFWGNDHAYAKPTGQGAWSIPTVDGYKTAFFQPPYSLHGAEQEHEQLLAQINAFILGADPQACEIFSWGTDWSNYFDAGKEWWGAFFWTLRQPGSDTFTVIGASTTD